jgi:hypothetical protein
LGYWLWAMGAEGNNKEIVKKINFFLYTDKF